MRRLLIVIVALQRSGRPGVEEIAIAIALSWNLCNIVCDIFLYVNYLPR